VEHYNTYDVELAKRLSADERAIYITRLMDAVQDEDYLAVLTLGYLKANEALPMLLALAKSDEPTASTARRALVALGRGADVIAEIANDAVNASLSVERFAAVIDLPKVGGPTALFALQQALLDEDAEVRVVAWDGLIEVLGLTKRLKSPDGIRELTTEVEVLRVLLGATRMELVRVGAAGMREVARRLAAGATPQQLGIAWRPRTDQDVFDRLRDGVFDNALPFPVEEIAKLVGSQRKRLAHRRARHVRARRRAACRFRRPRCRGSRRRAPARRRPE
jgi:hypothetical protein